MIRKKERKKVRFGDVGIVFARLRKTADRDDDVQGGDVNGAPIYWI